jgi:hypothetical protein
MDALKTGLSGVDLTLPFALVYCLDPNAAVTSSPGNPVSY